MIKKAALTAQSLNEASQLLLIDLANRLLEILEHITGFNRKVLLILNTQEKSDIFKFLEKKNLIYLIYAKNC